MKFKEILDKRFIFFDGAIGTMLQARGLKPGKLPELLNITNPDVVTRIHREYVEAGADVITANTFQANPLKCLSEYPLKRVIEAGITCARNAGAKMVALDAGPLGRLMSPMGTLGFDEAYGYFKEIVAAGESSGADLILFETFADLYEMKAAVLAAKENTSLPVICSLTFQDDGRTFVGADPACAAVTLQGLGVDALGVNCSLGPKELHAVVGRILKYSSAPVIVQPNAGLPKIRGGETVFNVTPEEFAREMSLMADKGVSILGGCCGTTPAHIKALKDAVSGKVFRRRHVEAATACSSGTKAVIIDGAAVIGERLNPTGKKKLKEAIIKYDKAYIVREAMDQTAAGSDILDVNVGLPDIDESSALVRTVRDVQEASPLPLQIDSSNPGAIAAAARIYNGKPVINSVNGKREVMDAVFPIVKKYGALVVALTLDERGIPACAEERFEIAKKIVSYAASRGIAKSEILIDCLVLTASAQQEQVYETLRAVRLVKENLGCKTILGVSNVSFGLPRRDLLNSVFLAAAFGAGLDAAIINPLSARYTEVVDAFRVFNNHDKSAKYYIEKYTGPDVRPDGGNPAEKNLSLGEIIIQGRREDSAAAARALLGSMAPMDIINKEFIPALNAVGESFEKGRIFLPQLLQSAQAVQNAFEVVKERQSLVNSKRESRGKILLATVQGDIHDIGKNIVKMILENYGFEIIDLGKDVKIEAVVDAVRAHNISLAGLSALMTTTIKSMKDTVSAVKNAGLDCKFIVGGAVLNEEYKDFVGADFYAKDAVETARIANKFFGSKDKF